MKFLKDCFWAILLLMLIDYFSRHLYGYRLVDIFQYFFNVSELLAR